MNFNSINSNSNAIFFKIFNFNSFDYNSYGYYASAWHKFYRFEENNEMPISLYYCKYTFYIVQHYLEYMVGLVFQFHFIQKIFVVVFSLFSKIFFINLCIIFFLWFVCFKDFRRDLFYTKFLLFSIYKKVREFLVLDSLTQVHWYFSIFIILTSYNFYSLLPKINNIITIITIPTFCAFWIFFTQNFMAIWVNREKWLFNFYPAKLLWYIAPLLIWIEQFSYFIRPLSLAIRIFANMLAGHMLVHIISSYGSDFFLNKFFIMYIMVIILLTVLNFLEYFICAVQPIIFLSLSSIFFNDVLLETKATRIGLVNRRIVV